MPDQNLLNVSMIPDSDIPEVVIPAGLPGNGIWGFVKASQLGSNAATLTEAQIAAIVAAQIAEWQVQNNGAISTELQLTDSRVTANLGAITVLQANTADLTARPISENWASTGDTTAIPAAKLINAPAGGVSALELERAVWQPTEQPDSVNHILTPPDDETGVQGVTDFPLDSINPAFPGVPAIPAGVGLQFSAVIDVSFPNGTDGDIPNVRLNFFYGVSTARRHTMALATRHEQISIALDRDFPYGTAGKAGSLVIEAEVSSRGYTARINLALSAVEMILTGALYDNAVNIAERTTSAEDEVLRGDIDANKARIDGNAASIAHTAQLIETSSPALKAFRDNLTETVDAGTIQTYFVDNQITQALSNPRLRSAHGFLGEVFTATDIDKGEALISDGTYYHDPHFGSITDDKVISIIIENPLGVGLVDHPDGLVRVRQGNATDRDTFSIGSNDGQMGITRTVLASTNTVAAHNKRIDLPDGAISAYFHHTETIRSYEPREEIWHLPLSWTNATKPSMSFKFWLDENNISFGTADRDSIEIADLGQDQDGFISAGNGSFNITFHGEEPFVNWFNWRYVAQDRQLILQYTPYGHSRTITTDFTVQLLYPVAAATTTIDEHLAFTPFAHQPVHSDTLRLTLNYLDDNTWQIIATDGNGAVLQKGSYDVGKFNDDDIIYFIGDTVKYQYLSFGGLLSLSIADLTALHNHAAQRGFGLFLFTDKKVFGLRHQAFFTAQSIDGLKEGQNWRTLWEGATVPTSWLAGTDEYNILNSPTTQALRVHYSENDFDENSILFIKGQAVFSGLSIFGFNIQSVNIGISKAYYEGDLKNFLQKIEFLTGTNE